MTTETAAADSKIKCELDGAMVHSIQIHLRKNHPDWTVEKYKEAYPSAPLLSEKAKDAVRMKLAEQKAADAEAAAGVSRKSLAEVFNLPPAKTINGRGEQIMIPVLDPKKLDEESRIHIPEVDRNYVFPIEHVKTILMGFALKKNVYAWGMHGTGKTTLFEQICANTNRPFMRVQHTIGTEESHVLGQYVVDTEDTKDEEGNVNGQIAVTRFNLGPLPMAMLNGWVYCADEYDAALPSVVILYQPVLEGKALIIKDAPPEFRVIKPHPDFRFVATGNTNGGGDETGLYQGTQIQNAANYSRFGITIEVEYADPKIEAAIVASQSGCRMEDSRTLVEFGGEIRKQFKGQTLSATISTRELITAAQLAIARGGDWKGGLMLAFANRLSRTDQETVKQYLQRIYGN